MNLDLRLAISEGLPILSMEAFTEIVEKALLTMGALVNSVFSLKGGRRRVNNKLKRFKQT
jgi:hypothetical protein